MVRLMIFSAMLVAVTRAADDTAIRQSGNRLRGPATQDVPENRRLWGGWYTLLNHLCPPGPHSHGICKHSNSGSGGSSSSSSSSGGSSSSSSSNSNNGGGDGGSYSTNENGEVVDQDGNVVQNYSGGGGSGGSVNRDAGSGGNSQQSSSRTANWMALLGAAVTTSLIAGAVVWKRKQQEEEEMGINHGLAGSVKQILDGASVNGSSTIATEDVTAGPDFVSLDGSAPHRNEIEMEPTSTTKPESSTYAM